MLTGLSDVYSGFEIEELCHESWPFNLMIYFSANCLSVGEELILIGCSDGIVRCFPAAVFKWKHYGRSFIRLNDIF